MTAIMILMALSLSFLFLFLNHPLSFGLILLMETLIISILTGMMNYNFWFSYILFLIMVGGMLILFIYMTSVASNEKFKFSFKMTFIMMMCLITALIISIFAESMLLEMNLNNFDLTNKKINNSISMSKYINYPTNSIMIMAITYLLITLIMVVKITNIQYGPLRQKL